MSDEKYYNGDMCEYYNEWQISCVGEIKEGIYYIYKNTAYCDNDWFLCTEYCSTVWRDTKIQEFYSRNKYDIDKAIYSCGGKSKSIPNEHYFHLINDYGYVTRLYENVCLSCKIDNEYKEIFICGCKDPILIYKLCYISDLKPNREYIISNFTKSKYKSGGIIKPGKYYINKKVMSILEKYFICEEDKIYCVYNNKKVNVKLTLITKDVIETDDDQILHQSLKLEIGNRNFTFYINDSKNINYMKTGKYCFLAMHLYNNLIYGYEFKEDKYYYLRYEEELVLKNIDKEIAKNFEEIKGQDLYTYLLSNNKNRGMTINIDKDHNITYRLVWLNDEFFKSKTIKTLDISLLKPQIINEDCENK